MQKKLLIVGIDPGTTLAYAAIDTAGNLVRVFSKKNIDLSTLIAHLIGLGKPLVITGDKEHTPEFVQKVAVKVGAKVVSPSYDLKVEEKRRLVKEYDTNNQHEIDALASAFFALNKVSPLLKKIDIFVKHYGKEKIRNELIEFVVGKELNIKDAADIIEEPEKEEVKIIKDVVDEKKLSEKDFLQLYRKYKDALEDIELLRNQNNKLRDRLKQIKKDYTYMFQKATRSQLDDKLQSLLTFKERRLKVYDSQIRQKENGIKEMQDEITTLIYFLSNVGSNILLKKLDNLGTKEFQKKEEILNISEGDVLLVKDPDIISDSVVDKIRDKVNYIFYKKKVSRKIKEKLPFVFIDSGKIRIEENSYFAITDKDRFNALKGDQDLIKDIVNNYQKSRKV